MKEFKIPEFLVFFVQKYKFSSCVLSLVSDLVHYEMVVMESTDGESPAVGLATCSPLMPTPTCVLLRDFFRWKAEGKGKVIIRCKNVPF